MGGDGGTIIKSRRYMRNAGYATHTGDPQRSTNDMTESLRLRQIMQTCAITGNNLVDQSSGIVACPYGRLYSREEAIKALMSRKESKDESIGWHVSGLRDLHPVRFHQGDNGIPSCPVMGLPLDGSHAALLIVQMSTNKKEKVPNVLSERAISMIRHEELQVEYGTFEKDNMIRLAPSSDMLDSIKEKWEIKRRKHFKLKRKKCRKNTNRPDKFNTESRDLLVKLPQEKCTAKVARKNVELALRSNRLLSGLFKTKRCDDPVGAF